MTKLDCTCDSRSREGSCRYCRDLFYKWSWKQRNKEKVRESNRRYQQSLSGKLSSRRRALRYRQRNLEKCRARDRQRPRPVPDEKTRARGVLNQAVRAGRLVREPCQVCGATERVEGHHPDYSKPLEVEWLCDTHHKELHWPLAA